MNKLTTELTSELHPQMAIIVYANENDIYYLERRNISKGKMGEGIPLSEKCMSDIVKTMQVSDTTNIHGQIPENMLFSDSRPGYEKYVWYRKPEKRMHYFTKSLDIDNGEIVIPGLVYAVKGNTLSVFAYKGKLNSKSKLYRGPFFNIYDNCSICLGNAKVSKPKSLTFDLVIKYWEDKFWLSEFSSTLGNNPVKSNLSSTLKSCIKNKQAFPLSELKSTKLTLQSIL